MIRLWFTPDDLARTVVGAADPFAETVLSLIPLRGGPHAPWRSRVRRLLDPSLLSLADLRPGRGPILDLMSVVGRSADFDEGLDRLLRASRGDLDAEITYFADVHGGIPRSLRPLLTARAGVPHGVAAALGAYHRTAVRPFWPLVRRHLDLERERATRLVADGGWAGLFAALGHAGLRWRAPVLEVRSDRPREYHLDGRGVLIAPSLFCPEPVFCHDMSGAHRHVLIYPTFPPAVADDRPPARAHAALLGATRSRVLAAAAGGGSSSDLAVRAGISLSSASEHARVLREAGLIRTERRGGMVHHTLTELGVRLLAGS